MRGMSACAAGDLDPPSQTTVGIRVRGDLSRNAIWCSLCQRMFVSYYDIVLIDFEIRCAIASLLELNLTSNTPTSYILHFWKMRHFAVVRGETL